MSQYIEIAKRQLTNLIERELENILNYPEDQVQEAYLDCIEHLEQEEIEPSLVALGAIFMQGLESIHTARLTEATAYPLVDLYHAHSVYPHTYYEIAPANRHGVYAILCDLDNGAIIGPMTQNMTAEHTAWLMRNHGK